MMILSDSTSSATDDLAWFWDGFAAIVAAPGGVARARELILSLAVQGKLVPQDVFDEPATQLLKRIADERNRLVKQGDLRKSAPLAPISADEIPFELPKSWVWTRLGEIGLISPRNKADDEMRTSFVPMPAIHAAYGAPITPEVRPWSNIKEGFTHFAEGDVALAKITPCFQNGKSAVMQNLENGIGAGTTELHIFRPLIGTVEPFYVLMYLKSPRYLSEGEAQMTGTAGQKRVPTSYFSHNPFPLPPLAEQQRIVARVDELMQLCDQLETATNALDECGKALGVAAVRRLANG